MACAARHGQAARLQRAFRIIATASGGDGRVLACFRQWRSATAGEVRGKAASGRSADVVAAAEPAVDEKWVAQQWGWTGPLVREELPDSIRAKRRLGDVAL